MGFEVEWTLQSHRELDAVLARPTIADLFVLRAVAGRLHNEWLYGRPFEHPGLADRDIRLLENGSVSLVYALFESENRVRILAILRNLQE